VAATTPIQVPVQPIVPPIAASPAGTAAAAGGAGSSPAANGNGSVEASARTRATDARRARADGPTTPPANGDGFVALAVSPWGEVVVNGNSRGVSPPLTRLTLPPGVHAVEIRNGAAPPMRARVEVRPGQTVALQHRF
jgi:eukaryotic-like serine/threonine-protein kinase